MGQDSAPPEYQQLTAIYRELSESQSPARWPQGFGPEEAEESRRRLRDWKERFARIEPHKWSRAQKVDYLLVRAKLDDLEFRHRVSRPWARDPGFHLDRIERLAYRSLPLSAQRLEELRTRLGAVPVILEKAKSSLTEGSGELARMALRRLQRYDGIGQGQPQRSDPPEGILGWYRDLQQRLETVHPQAAPEAEKALAAAAAFRDWLRKRLSSMTAPAGVGLKNYEWYVRHVRLIPFSVEELRALGQRETNRSRAFLAIERHRNRRLPELTPASSREEYEGRVRRAEQRIRGFIQEHDLMTIPPDTPSRFETDAFWIVRPGGKRHFWEELQYRDALNNHIHASIPGHRFDAWRSGRELHPIRSSYRDGGRAEGWATYLEEMLLQAGLLDDTPRVRELFYIALLARAVRIPAELKLHSGEFSLQQAIDYMVAEVPFMEESLARYDLEIYLRRPAYGMNYVASKAQMEQLVADSALQLGESFDLKRFHDAFLSSGMIPMSLIRWEMTGRDDEVKLFWQRKELGR